MGLKRFKWCVAINVSCKKLKRFKNDFKWVKNDLSGERLIFMNVAYNMDCLPAMRETPDNFYDLAVCDPPYGDGRGGVNHGTGSENGLTGTNKVSRTGRHMGGEVMNKNSNLHKAKKKKNDEFYTQLSDIENELRHYKEHFRGKVVYCNCDDPYESNIFKYFAMNFNSLGLKKLIATGYATSPVAGKELSQFEDEVGTPKNQSYAVYINEVTDSNGDGQVDITDLRLLLKTKKNTRRRLYGDEFYPAGDFRSKESVALLQQVDIVVTNPPFSLFREYIAQLEEFRKKYIIWGSENALSYREVFSLLKDNKVWIGYTANATKVFRIPIYYKKFDKKITEKMNDGNKYCRVSSITVYTNLDIKKRNEYLNVYKEYCPEEYPKYDNYDAINVNKVLEIPYDYDGVMGVPVSFLNSYNPNQFEIVGLGYGKLAKQIGITPIGKEFLALYKQQGNKGNYVPNNVLCCYIDNNGKAKIPYARVLIRKKK